MERQREGGDNYPNQSGLFSYTHGGLLSQRLLYHQAEKFWSGTHRAIQFI